MASTYIFDDSKYKIGFAGSPARGTAICLPAPALWIHGLKLVSIGVQGDSYAFPSFRRIGQPRIVRKLISNCGAVATNIKQPLGGMPDHELFAGINLPRVFVDR